MSCCMYICKWLGGWMGLPSMASWAIQLRRMKVGLAACMSCFVGVGGWVGGGEKLCLVTVGGWVGG